MTIRISWSRLPWHSWCHDPHLGCYDPGFCDIRGAMTTLPWHLWCHDPCYHDIQDIMFQVTMVLRMSWSRLSWHSGCHGPGYHDIQDVMTKVTMIFMMSWPRILWHSIWLFYHSLEMLMWVVLSLQMPRFANRNRKQWLTSPGRPLPYTCTECLNRNSHI